MTQKVIDVSQWQGNVDWAAVKKAGYHAIIRCGFGNDEASQDDPYFKRNADECERLGIPYGVYLYSYATNADMARSEAKHVLRLIKGRKLSYPVYFDAEENGTQGASKACAIVFGDAIEKAGYWCGVYASASWWKSYLTGLDRFTKWVAHWGVSSPAVKCDLWQYADNGSVPGVSGNCDVNYCYRDFHSAINGKAKKELKKNSEIVLEVLNGKWGTGNDRKKKLEAAGYNYDTIQSTINKVFEVLEKADA